MGRHKQLYSLLDIKKKTGISYPTLINYARDFADQIPTVGTGRNRRYTAESVKVFQRIFAKRRPGRKPGAAWAKHPPGTPATMPGEKGSPTPSGTSALHQEDATAFSGPLQLAEEDRELIRNLTEALREHAARMEAWLTALGLGPPR
jgi:hypothetical protein